MTDEERIEAFNEGVEFCERSLARDLNALRRYREREELVQSLLESVEYAKKNFVMLGSLPLSRASAVAAELRVFGKVEP